jgi:hypothetical protein
MTSVIPSKTNVPIPTFTPVSTLTLTLFPLMPTITPTTIPTTKVERWMEYENALALAFLPWSGNGLCEWELLGQSEHEVYVWAICQIADSPEGAAMSAPAVIYLKENNSIEKVEIPRDGAQYSVDIRQMFPQNLQEKILSNSINSMQKMWDHIQLRHKYPEPPLIVGSGILLP